MLDGFVHFFQEAWSFLGTEGLHAPLWFLGILVVQLLLCYLVKPKWLRLMPVILLGVATILCILFGCITIIFPIFLTYMLFYSFFLVLCTAMAGLGWLIWGIGQRRRMKGE